MINSNNHCVLILLMLCFSCSTNDDRNKSVEIIEIEAEEKVDVNGMVLLRAPMCEHELEIITHHSYSLAYSELDEQAAWVQYKLFRSNLELPQVKRKNKFKTDQQVATNSATLKDYSKSGYDRGHLAPCADFTYSETCMLESFYMSNMSPQVPSFNRGKWKSLESKVRLYATKYDSLLVITGPVLFPEEPKIFIGDGVTVPEYYYKIIVELSTNKAVAYLMPNEKIKDDISNYIVSINTVEEITHIDFLYDDSICVPCDIEEEINMTF